MPVCVEQFRELATDDTRHGRTADIFADLFFGFVAFLTVAQEVGAIDVAVRDQLFTRAQKH